MPRFAANISMLFQEAPFLDRFALARAAGFATVECQFPYEFPAAEIAARLDAEGLRLLQINLPAGDWAAGERGIAILPDRVEQFRDGVLRAIDYAGALGCVQINCIAGVAPEGVLPARLEETLLGNLRFAAEALGGAGLRLLIEPVNSFDIPGFFLTRTAQAVALVGAAGAPNLFVQFDAYHMRRMGEPLAETVEANLASIGHVQFADCPGRREPGTGEIDFPAFFAHLDRIGYAGWTSAEYTPSGRTIDSLGWMTPPG